MSSLPTRPPFPHSWSSLPLPLSHLSLPNTLPVGQSFLWHRHPLPAHPDPTLPTEEWSRAVHSPARVLLLRQSSTHLYYTSISPTPAKSATEQDTAFIHRYFSLHTPPLPDLYASWARIDPLLFGKAYHAEQVPQGVRVLQQDGWECLIAFITSSANNVPRITSLMHKLSHHFSPPLLALPAPSPSSAEPLSTTYHLFPPPSALLSLSPTSTIQPLPELEQTLRDLGFGYRANFISSTLDSLCAKLPPSVGTPEEAGLWISAYLEELKNEPGERWREELLGFKGVGRKVADCIGLMSMSRPNIVPIDTHLLQIAARHPSFPGRLKGKATSSEGVYKEVQGFLAGVWGGVGDVEAPKKARKGKGKGKKEEIDPAIKHDNTDELGAGMAGWIQAIMFASDLKGSLAVNEEGMVVSSLLVKEEALVIMEEYLEEDIKPDLTTPRKRRKIEDTGPATPALSLSGSSSVGEGLFTPVEVKTEWLEAEAEAVDSPLKGYGGVGLAERIEGRKRGAGAM